jgi:demethylmenaquinone methyltransferase/2-methoxy-6-polyprenyl-1,4-benzoquinol methylase
VQELAIGESPEMGPALARPYYLGQAMPPPNSTTPSATGWTDADLAANPHQDAEKSTKVRGMFAAIAHAYDLNNRLHSFGRDQAWRRFAVRQGMVRPGDRVLDVACGTGDLTEAFAASDAGEVVGCDFTREMLEVARTKARRLPAPISSKVRYEEGDAQNLAFPDASFDVVSIAFGIRNVERPARAIAEFRRVLKPGGRLIVLEFDRPAFAPIRWMNTLYTTRIMPLTATLISRDRSGAYKYLPRSVGTFMSRGEMLQTITRAGFATVMATPLTFGVCVCYRGEVMA